MGSKIHRKYDKPKTHLQRLIESGYADPQVLNHYLLLQQTLDSFTLKNIIKNEIKSIVIKATADHCGHNRLRGTLLDEDRRIPWVVWGGLGQKSLEVKQEIKTLRYRSNHIVRFGCAYPQTMVGQPVREALRGPVSG